MIKTMNWNINPFKKLKSFFKHIGCNLNKYITYLNKNITQDKTDLYIKHGHQ